MRRGSSNWCLRRARSRLDLNCGLGARRVLVAVVVVRLSSGSGINPDGSGDTDSLNRGLDFSNPDKVALAVVQRDSIAEHDERAEGGDDVLGVHVDGESCVYFWNDTVDTAIRPVKRVKEGGKSASDFWRYRFVGKE